MGISSQHLQFVEGYLVLKDKEKTLTVIQQSVTSSEGTPEDCVVLQQYEFIALKYLIISQFHGVKLKSFKLWQLSFKNQHIIE